MGRRALKVFVFGDSHAGKFGVDPRFTLVGPNAPTAYSLANENSKSQSLFMLRQMLHDVTTDDIVLFVLGEIDCRIHIYRLHKETGLSYGTLCARTIVRYGRILDSVKKMNTPKVAVLDVPPAVAQENIYGYDIYGSRDERAEIARIFNQQLEGWCSSRNICFVNLYQHIADSRGWLKDEYAVWDGAHVHENTVPLVVKELAKCFEI